RFQPLKWQNFRFEVEAKRVDSSMAPVVTLLEGRGKDITNNDDSESHNERVAWRAPPHNDDYLDVNDHDARDRENFAYLLAARRTAHYPIDHCPELPRADLRARLEGRCHHG